MDGGEARWHVLAGMLDRDQRTARTAASGRRGGASGAAEGVPGCVRDGGEDGGSERRTGGGGRRGMRRLLLVGACLSIVSGPREACGAPAAAPMDDRWLRPARWLNPCGGFPQEQQQAPVAAAADEFLANIEIAAKVAHETVQRAKAEYAAKTWNMDEGKLSNMFKAETYSWLPNLEERLGEEAVSQHTMDENLSFMYTSLQKIAAGVEQMIWDEEDAKGPFQDRFNQTYNALISVLCEIQLALPRPVTPVTRDHLSADDRRADSSERTRRDFVVLRECGAAMRLVLDALPLLKVKP